MGAEEQRIPMSRIGPLRIQFDAALQLTFGLGPIPVAHANHAQRRVGWCELVVQLDRLQRRGFGERQRFLAGEKSETPHRGVPFGNAHMVRCVMGILFGGLLETLGSALHRLASFLPRVVCGQ